MHMQVSWHQQNPYAVVQQVLEQNPRCARSEHCMHQVSSPWAYNNIHAPRLTYESLAETAGT